VKISDEDFVDIEQVLLSDSDELAFSQLVQLDSLDCSLAGKDIELLSAGHGLAGTKSSKMICIGNASTASSLPPKYYKGKNHLILSNLIDCLFLNR
jgi:hypothetical protein